MNKKISLGAALALLLMVAALVFSVTWNRATADFNSRVSDLRDRERMYEKYTELDGLVRRSYYGEINETQLMNSVAQGYIEGVGDKYGRYISADEYKRILEEGDAENVGIGAVIEISPDDFYLVVVEVYPDSPAEVAGIEVGDLIIQIDDTELSRENSRQMLDAISGPQGSNISIITRRGGVESGPHNMVRRSVPVPTVLYSRMLEDSTVGYIHISEFRERSYDQFNRDLLTLLDQGATSLVVDLRDNNSDYLSSATRILDRLLPEGVLVSAAYKNGAVEVLATSDANALDIPVVVLTNSATTGAAEIFAQNVKDFEQGSTVGVGTAGKGVMQSILKLSDGSAIEISVAYYLTGSGQTFHTTGVRADYEVQMDFDWKDFIENEANDTQLTKAKEVAISLQRVSPGGEAVQPDQQTEEQDAPAPQADPDLQEGEDASVDEQSGEQDDADDASSQQDEETDDDQEEDQDDTE